MEIGITKNNAVRWYDTISLTSLYCISYYEKPHAAFCIAYGEFKCTKIELAYNIPELLLTSDCGLLVNDVPHST